jgi:hypothetical protein
MILQYEMLLSNDLQLLHSIEATTDTSVIFPTKYAPPYTPPIDGY